MLSRERASLYSVSMDIASVGLQKSVLAALAYFDVFRHPLTLAEVAKFRFVTAGDDAAASHGDILSALDDPRIGERDGLYFLRGRDAIVDERKRRQRIAGRKFARARLAAVAFGRIPGVRFVSVCNSLAFGAADDDSDIDLFVATDPGAIWSGRLVAAGLTHMLGLRPTEHDQRDKICLSFFATTDALDLSGLAIGDDPYLQYWIATLAPIYDDGGIAGRFRQANRWVTRRLPAAFPHAVGVALAGDVPPASAVAPGFFETNARRWQEKKFPSAIRDLMNKDSRVVVNDSMLKFHVNDRREEFAMRFHDRLAAIGIAP